MVATYQPAVSSASNQNAVKSFETIDEKQNKKIPEPFMARFNGRSVNHFILKLHGGKI
jgi:hypothetical protein